MDGGCQMSNNQLQNDQVTQHGAGGGGTPPQNFVTLLPPPPKKGSHFTLLMSPPPQKKKTEGNPDVSPYCYCDGHHTVILSVIVFKLNNVMHRYNKDA